MGFKFIRGQIFQTEFPPSFYVFLYTLRVRNENRTAPLEASLAVSQSKKGRIEVACMLPNQPSLMIIFWYSFNNFNCYCFADFMN